MFRSAYSMSCAAWNDESNQMMSLWITQMTAQNESHDASQTPHGRLNIPGANNRLDEVVSRCCTARLAVNRAGQVEKHRLPHSRASRMTRSDIANDQTTHQSKSDWLPKHVPKSVHLRTSHQSRTDQLPKDFAVYTNAPSFSATLH